MFDLPYEICRRTAFHIIPYCSWPTAGLLTAVNYKMADRSRGAIKKRKKKERMAKTHFGNLASPPLLLQLPMGSNKREDLDVNHFLQVVNSQGRQNESDVCVFIPSGGIAATLGQKAWLLFSHTLPQTLENVGLWSPDKANSSHSPCCCCCWSWMKLSLLIFIERYHKSKGGENTFILSKKKLVTLLPLFIKCFYWFTLID